MIYRIVEESTGHIVKSIDCSPTVAFRYLQEGQILVVAGTTLQVDDTLLEIADGALIRKAGVPDIGGFADEGSLAVPVQPPL